MRDGDNADGRASRAVMEALVKLRGDRAEEIFEIWQAGKLSAEYAEAALEQEREAEAERRRWKELRAWYEGQCGARWSTAEAERRERQAQLDRDQGLGVYETMGEIVARQNRRYSR